MSTSGNEEKPTKEEQVTSKQETPKEEVKKETVNSTPKKEEVKTETPKKDEEIKEQVKTETNKTIALTEKYFSTNSVTQYIGLSAGSIAGATSGAILGSTLFPFAGTLVGSIIGGVVGGLGLGIGGSVVVPAISAKISDLNKKEEVTFGKGIYSTLNSKIIKKEHPVYGGYGLFATAPIKKGEIVWKENKSFEDTPEYSFEEISKWPKEKQDSFTHFAYQISETHMKGPNPDKKITPDDDAANFYNHSCDPTTWYDSYTVITARRDIKEGEEITYDYCTSELNETKKITDCGCKSQNCRKKITRDDCKIPELQERYKGHFLPHVQFYIDKK